MQNDDFQQAKAYALSLRYEGLRQIDIIERTISEFGMDEAYRGRLQTQLTRHGITSIDNSMCGIASLKALKLPFNRIAEAFA